MRQPLFCMHSCMNRSSQPAVRKTMPHGPVRCMDILHSGPSKAPFIGELAAEGGLRG